MARRNILQGLRRRGAVLGAVFAYTLLLTALTGVVRDVQAVAAALDPLSNAPICDLSGSGSGDPLGHKREHQPDCTLCGPACPLAGVALDLDGVPAMRPTPPTAFELHVPAQRTAGVNPPSLYRSDTDAQAPPALG